MQAVAETMQADGRLSPAEWQAWRRDGFFIRRRVFGPEEIEALRDATERAVARATEDAAREGQGYAIDGNRYWEAGGTTIQFEHGEDSRTVRVLEPFHHLDERFERLIDDPRFVEPMRDLVGSERIALFTAKLNLKRPREGSRFRWHQDSPYWAHFFPEVERLPNAMLALDDAHEHNGCLRVIRGSHRAGMLPGREGEGVLGPLFTRDDQFDAREQVPAVMPAGSVLFFSPNTVHGSEPNESEALRRALLFTYQPGGHRLFKVDAHREAGL